MRYPEQRSLISALLQLDVYYRSARSTPTLSQYVHAYMDDCTGDRWLREGKYFAACVRRYARICVNMDAIYPGMRGHNTSTNARECVRRTRAICDKRDETALGPFESMFLWSHLVPRARNGHEFVMYSRHVSRESTKPIRVILSGSNGLRIQRL